MSGNHLDQMQYLQESQIYVLQNCVMFTGTYFRFVLENIFHAPLYINNYEVTIVNHFKYLDVVIDNSLTWSFHADNILSKCKQRLFFLRLLKSFNVSTYVMFKFYSSLVKSIICHNISVWGNSLSLCVQKKLTRICKLASKLIDVSVLTASYLNYSVCHQ